MLLTFGMGNRSIGDINSYLLKIGASEVNEIGQNYRL